MLLRPLLSTQPSTDQLLEVAAALESFSEHPIEEAIAQFARQQNPTWTAAVNVQAHAGQGITGEIAGQSAIVGKTAFVQVQVNDVAKTLIEQSQQ